MLACQGHPKATIATCRFVGTSLIVMFLAGVWGDSTVSAQARSDIRPNGGDQTISHNEQPEAQSFNSTSWDVGSKGRSGATVTLSCGPFQSKEDPRSYIDGQLRLRVRSSQNKPNWQTRIAADRTNVIGGRKTATVMATSEDKGSGVLELMVTFLGADVTDLVEGEYSTTVTGTITAR